MKLAMSRDAYELRRLEVEVRRAPDAYTRTLREQELAELRRRLAPRGGRG